MVEFAFNETTHFTNLVSGSTVLLAMFSELGGNFISKNIELEMKYEGEIHLS